VHSSRPVDEHRIVTEEAGQLIYISVCESGKEIAYYRLRRIAHLNHLCLDDSFK
jgi:hypothetical protein